MSMKLNFKVIYLDDETKAQEQFKKNFSQLEGYITDFFIDTFSSKDFVPEIVIDLEVFSSVRKMTEYLIDFDDLQKKNDKSISILKEQSESIGLFFLDYYLPEGQNDTKVPAKHIGDYKLDKQFFTAWLNNLFPHVPVFLLTTGGAGEVDLPSGWDYLSKDSLGNIDELGVTLNNYFSNFWEPNFSLILEKYGARDGSRSYHTPGHNAGNAFLRSPLQKSFYNSYKRQIFATDISVSVDELGDLSEPDLESPLKTSMLRSSEIFGSEETFYITNGTSTSNKAMLMTLLRPGEVVLLDRNCHKSVHQAVVMSGAVPLYLEPTYNNKLGVWLPHTLTNLEDFIEADYPEAIKPRMLILTTCTYEGVLYPINEIALTCERNGILFYADEAWAPYLRFHPFYTNKIEGHVVRLNAMDAGANFAVQSTHKALAAFSQASMIHIGKSFKKLFKNKEFKWLSNRFSSYERFRHDLHEILRYWHSTSPNYPMLATLDRSGVQMRLEGTKLLSERLRWVKELTEEVNTKAGRICIVTFEHLVGDINNYDNYIKDPLKLIIGFKNENCGIKFKKILESEKVKWEKSSSGCIEFLFTIGTFINHKELLLKILLENVDLLGLKDPKDYKYSDTSKEKADFDKKIAVGQVAILPREAINSPSKLILIEESVGYICAQMLVPYPPGIPIFLPGLRITDAMVDLVKKVINEGSSHDVHGLFEDSNGKFCVKVLSEKEVKISNNLQLLNTKVKEILKEQ